MEKREELIALLTEFKHTNVTYEQLAEKLGMKVNTLYTWMQKGNVSEKKAAYVMSQIERHFPDEYCYLVVSMAYREVESELRAEM